MIFIATNARIYSNLKQVKLNFMTDIIYKKESYQIIGLCMEVHNHFGKGFLEIVY